MTRADLVLHNGRIVTYDDAGTVADAIAIADGRIVAIGSEADVRPFAPAGAEVVDLQGRTAMPGLIDAHTHVELGARARYIWSDVRHLDRVAIAAEVRRLVAARAPGSWIVLQGTYRQDLPDRAELDRIAPHNPVAIRWSMHMLNANSAALAASGIDRAYQPPPGSRVERDADGNPTGFLEEGFDLLAIPPTPQPTLRDALQRSLREQFLANGITTVYELPASTDAVRSYQELQRNGELPLRMSLNMTIPPGHQPVIELDELLRSGLQTGFGDEWLAVGAVKVFADGDEEAAAHSRLLSGRPGDWGLFTRTYQQLAREVMQIFAAGMQVWIHAIGDVAQEMAIDAIREANRVHPGLRPRIEHVANLVTDPTQLDRIQAAGAIPVPTAAFMHGTAPDDAMPPGALRYAYRTLIDRGFMPPGNSDSAGTQPFAINPFHGVYHMVARRNVRGESICPSEAVSVREALTTYTRYAAHAAFKERSRGSLEVGKLGDVVVLDRDPEQSPVEQLRDVRADLTIVGGAIAYERGRDPRDEEPAP